MQPIPGSGWGAKKKAPAPKLAVDPRPGRKAPMPVVDPRPGRKVPNPGLGTKPGKGTGIKVPNPGMGTDDKIYRTMPITEKQLGAIKKMYGIK